VQAIRNALWIVAFVVLAAVLVTVGLLRRGGGTEATHRIGVVPKRIGEVLGGKGKVIVVEWTPNPDAGGARNRLYHASPFPTCCPGGPVVPDRDKNRPSAGRRHKPVNDSACSWFACNGIE